MEVSRTTTAILVSALVRRLRWRQERPDLPAMLRPGMHSRRLSAREPSLDRNTDDRGVFHSLCHSTNHPLRSAAHSTEIHQRRRRRTILSRLQASLSAARPTLSIREAALAFNLCSPIDCICNFPFLYTAACCDEIPPAAGTIDVKDHFTTDDEFPCGCTIAGVLRMLCFQC